MRKPVLTDVWNVPHVGQTSLIFCSRNTPPFKPCEHWGSPTNGKRTWQGHDKEHKYAKHTQTYLPALCGGSETELSFCLILDLQPTPKVSYVSVIRTYFKTGRKVRSHTCLYWVCLFPAASPSQACLQHSGMNWTAEAWVRCLGPFIRIWHQNGGFCPETQRHIFGVWKYRSISKNDRLTPWPYESCFYLPVPALFSWIVDFLETMSLCSIVCE